MPSVLFVCTGNICRSPAAAALFLERLRRQGMAAAWAVGSAGTWATPGDHIHPLVRRVLLEYGIETRRHRARRISPRVMAQADLVLGVTRHHVEALRAEFPHLAHRVHLFSTVAGYDHDIPDPEPMTVQEVRRIIEEIHNVISLGFQHIIRKASTAPRATPR